MVYLDSLFIGGLSGSLYFLILFKISLLAKGDLKAAITLSSIFIVQSAVGRLVASVGANSAKSSFLVKYGITIAGCLGIIVIFGSTILENSVSVLSISVVGILWGAMSAIGKISNRLEGSLSEKFDARLFSINSVVGWGVGVVMQPLPFFQNGFLVVIGLWVIISSGRRGAASLLAVGDDIKDNDGRVFFRQLKDLRFVSFVFCTSFLISFFNSSIVPLATVNLNFDRESLGLLFSAISISSLILLVVPRSAIMWSKLYHSWIFWGGITCLLFLVLFFLRGPGIFVGASIAFGLTSTILIQHQIKSASDSQVKSFIKARHTLIEVLSIPSTLVVYFLMHR